MARRNGFTEWGWTDMEDLLQCPVCLDKPAAGTMVHQCQNGHHVCSSCKTQVFMCPICKSTFLGTRNFVVEELINHYEILKNIMLLSNITEDSTIKKKKKKPRQLPKFAVEAITRRKFNTPKINKGCYPCRADGCQEVLYLSRLLNHSRSLHKDMLTESQVDENEEFHKTIKIVATSREAINTQTFIFSIKGIGVVYLTIQILRTGHFIAFIQMASCLTRAENILATLKFPSSRNASSVIVHKQRLISVRDTTKGMMQRKLCCVLDKNQFKGICLDKTFTCILSLTKYIHGTPLSDPNQSLIETVSAIRNSLISQEEEVKAVADTRPDEVRSDGYCNGTKPKPNSFIHKKQVNGNANTVINLSSVTVSAAPTQSKSQTDTTPKDSTNSSTNNTAAGKKKRHKKKRNTNLH